MWLARMATYLQGMAKKVDEVDQEQLEENIVVAARDHREEGKANASEQKTCKQELSASLEELLSERFPVIGQGLDEYCENPSAGTFMQIYTCIYDLCNDKDHKNAVCAAVYDFHCRETQLCAQRLVATCQRLAAAPASREVIPQVLLEWQWLSRRFHVLQGTFGYIDRYYVPRARLEPLAALRLTTLQAAGFEEHASMMWNVLATSLRGGCAAISFKLMREIIDAWGSLSNVAGMQEAAVTSAVIRTLREHLATSFTESRCPPGTAADRVLGMQRPLVREITEFLSEQDLWQMYSVQNMQKSTSALEC